MGEARRRKAIAGLEDPGPSAPTPTTRRQEFARRGKVMPSHVLVQMPDGREVPRPVAWGRGQIRSFFEDREGIPIPVLAHAAKRRSHTEMHKPRLKRALVVRKANQEREAKKAAHAPKDLGFSVDNPPAGGE